jgi:putative intracellular protease/amidase
MAMPCASTLVEAGVVKGCTMTSWPSLKTDLKNAGANWVDREVVRDEKLVSSGKPVARWSTCSRRPRSQDTVVDVR